MVLKSSTLGIVAISMAAFSVDQIVTNAFVQPRGTHHVINVSSSSSSSTRQLQSTPPPLHMSVSPIPDDSNKWDKSKPSSSRAEENNSNSIPDTPNEASADSLESLEGPHLRSEETNNFSTNNEFTTEKYDGHDGAFPLPNDVSIPKTRQLRWEREALVKSKFATGDEVFELRSTISELRKELIEVREQVENDAFVTTTTTSGTTSGGVEKRTAMRRIAQLEKELLAQNGRDAEFMYAVSLELMEKAKMEYDAAGSDGSKEMVEKYRIQVEEARACIPQLNMHGLWVGKYGDHGYEMINVTYSGDTLIATKVTGDKNVPKGETTFTVDLSPRSSQTITTDNDTTSSSSSSSSPLEPIELNTKAAAQWGKKYLPRHSGKGQVASENFTNAQWMEGQLILVGRFFSFAWVPIGHQVFFGRPSSELTLKMFRESEEEEMRKDHVEVMRVAAEGMWGETYWEEREMRGVNYYSEEGCFE